MAQASQKNSKFKKMALPLGAAALVLLLALAAAWYFLGGGEGLKLPKLFQQDEEPSAGVEPPLPPGSRVHTVKAGEDLFSIAEKGNLVDSPWEWRTILIQNQDKIQYVFHSEVQDGWVVMMEEGAQLAVKPGDGSKPFVAAKGNKYYAVQIATLPTSQLERAMGLVSRLLAGGHYGYLYRASVSGKEILRIRSGFYETRDEAERASRAIKTAMGGRDGLTGPYWVVEPGPLETSGDLMDFGAQRTRPWVAELAERDSHAEAMADLKALGRMGIFSYVSQRQDKETGQFVYRTRVGFYSSQQEVAQAISANKRAAAVLSGARPVKVADFNEIYPGQLLRFKPGQQAPAAETP